LYRVGLLYQIYVVCTLNLIAMALIWNYYEEKTNLFGFFWFNWKLLT
jgi:hypothetical protein